MKATDGGSGSAPAPCKGFLRRLTRDARGNTLAIVGAAMVPLSGMIGSGVDMSRAYMAKTRLQSACDAGALAGRRIMANDTLTTAVEQEAIRFFRFNFREGLYDTAAFTPVVTRPESGTVRVTASTTIPTTIMGMFGFTNLPLNVSCEASLNFVNTDIMLVLDVTGSMAENLSGTQKIVALRDAVMALYEELEPVQVQLAANNLRLRYGVVPYSSAVNVGNLVHGANASYIRDTSPYQSREAYFNTATYVPNAPTSVGPVYEYFRNNATGYTTNVNQATSITRAHCTRFIQNLSFSRSGSPSYSFTSTDPDSGGPAPTPTVVKTYPNDGNANAGNEWGWAGAPVTSGTFRTCRRRMTATTTTYATRYSFTNWIYRQADFDTADLRDGSTAIVTNTGGTVATAGYYTEQALAAGAGGASGFNTASVSWSGCIEERDTTSAINTSPDYTIPSDANDLNVNLVPTSEATRWRPHWPRMVYRRAAGVASTTNSGQVTHMNDEGAAYIACPTEARRLQAWTEAQMQTYVDQLGPIGGTYHDIGMIWGARMISNAGIFADSPDVFNGMPVSRHIIFMTDGQLAPNCNTYTSYGLEQNDTRVTGSGSCPQQHDRHMQRFKMICNAAKSMNVSIWVIAFGTTLSSEMTECASNSNQASTSGDRDQLIARFREIGSNIGALRLTQ